MFKHFTLFSVSLAALVFISGCQSTKPEPAKMPEIEPVIPQSVEIELPKPGPPIAQPNEIDIEKIEPDEPEIPRSEPNEPEIVVAEPNELEPDKPQPGPVVSFHDKCLYIFSNFVNDRGMVNYKELRRKRYKIRELLDEFAELDPSEYNRWTKEDKIAFWLNAYNVQMLKIIVDNYPIKSSRWGRIVWGPKSIRNIPPTLTVGVSKWDRYKFIVMDEQFTLSEIERRFFHKEFDEPRVFFALSQASLSGPPSRNEPYYGYKLYEQLNDQVKKILSSLRAFKIDRENQKVYLSAIFQPDWQGKHFIPTYGTAKKFKDKEQSVRAVLNFTTRYISREDVYFLETGNYSVNYINFNWNLNE